MGGGRITRQPEAMGLVRKRMLHRDKQGTTAAAFTLATLAFSEFLTFTITPVLRIDDAVGPIMDCAS